MRRSLAPCLALILLSACESDELSGSTLSTTTAISVRPSQFLGDVACSDSPGSLRAYTLTLLAFDDETDTTPFELPTSPPTPCSHEAAFREGIVVGKRYIAEIAGYEQLASSLEPFGGPLSGSRTLVNVSDGQTVQPRWTTTCGSGATDAAVSLSSANVLVPDCLALFDSQGSATKLRIDPAAVLGDSPCSVGPAFDVLRLRPEDSYIEEQRNVACDAEPFDLPLASTRAFDVYARVRSDEADADGPALGATCSVLPQAGSTAQLRCNPLVSTGMVTIDLSGLTQDGDSRCPENGYFFVRNQGADIHSLPLPCGNQAQLGPLEAGLYSLSVDIYTSEHESAGAVTQCAVELEAGKNNLALCL